MFISQLFKNRKLFLCSVNCVYFYLNKYFILFFCSEVSLGPIFMKTPAAHFELHANMVGHLREIMTVFLVYGISA